MRCRLKSSTNMYPGAGTTKRLSQTRRLSAYTPFIPRATSTFLLPKNQTVKALPTEVKDPITEKLENYVKLPLSFDEKKHEVIHIRDHITPRAEGETFFKGYVPGLVDYILRDYEHGSDPSTINSVHEYLLEDPVGVDTIPTTDRKVWKLNSGYSSDNDSDEDNEKHILSTFGRNLIEYQREMYNYMRASLPQHLDARGAERLRLFINGREYHLNREQKLRRLDKDIRVPWAKMKEYVLSTICENTLGSYHYLPLHKLKRNDNVLFPEWMSNVRSIVSDIKNYGRGWEGVVDVEALHVLEKWLAPNEVKDLDNFLVRKNLHPELNDVRYMVQNVEFDKFVETFIEINRDKLPKKFTQALQKEALKSTILTYGEAIDMVKKQTAKFQKEINQLKEEVARLKKGKRRRTQTDPTKDQEDTPPQKRGKTTPSGSDKNEDTPYVPGPDEFPTVKINKKYGKTKQGCCQRCHNLGMKNRKHRGPCKKEFRDKAHAKFLKKNQRKRDNAKDNADDNNRKFDLADYPTDACEWCIKEDVDPKFSAFHKGDQCYRRKNGLLDQKGIKGKEARTKEVIRLNKLRRAENAKKHGKGGATATNRSTQKVLTPRISITRPARPTVTFAASVSPTATKKKKPTDISPNDPRLSAVQKHIKPNQYIRNPTAIALPMSTQELHYGIVNGDGIIKEDVVQHARMMYEQLNNEDKLVHLRETLPSRHPRPVSTWTELWSGRDLVNKIGGEFEPFTGSDRCTGETQTMEVAPYKRNSGEHSKYTQMIRDFIPFLKNKMHFKTDEEAMAMADSIHARWDRSPQRVHGEVFEHFKQITGDHKWNGFLYPSEGALKHAPFALAFPLLRSIRTAAEAILVRNGVQWYIKNHKLFKGDRFNYFSYLDRLEELHKELIKLENAKANSERRVRRTREQREKSQAHKERQQRLAQNAKHQTDMEATKVENQRLASEKKQLEDKIAQLEKDKRHAESYKPAAQRWEREQKQNRKRVEEAKAKGKTRAKSKRKGKTKGNKARRRRPRKHKPQHPYMAVTCRTELLPEPREPPSDAGPQSKYPNTPLRVSTDTQPVESTCDAGRAYHTKPLRARRGRRTRRTTRHAGTQDGESYIEVVPPGTLDEASYIEQLFGTSSDPDNDDTYTVTSSSDSETEVNNHGECNCTHTRSTQLPPELVAEKQPERRTIKKDKAYYDLFAEILDLPLGTWCPATTKENPVARTYVSVNKQQDTKTDGFPLHSEKPGLRLLQAYVNYRDRQGNIKKGRVQLDTYSNVNYVSPEVGLPRPHRHPWEATKVRGITNNTIRLGKPRTFTMMKDDEAVVIDCNTAPEKVLKGDCVALLGLDAITMLGIDLNYAVEHNKHMDVRFKIATHELCDRAKRKAIDKYENKQIRLERYVQATCSLSERICAEYVKQHPDDYISKAIQTESIDVCPSVPAEYKNRILSFLMKYTDVFAQSTNTLPRTLKQTPPHSFKLREDATPVRTGRPRFGKAQAQIINDWVKWALEVGLIERATTTSWSSRLILAPKYNHDTPKSALPDGIRVAWAGVEVNERIQKTVPTYPDAWEQLYKVANYKYKFSADGLKQYWSIPLDKKSREVTAFWTPQGLFQFKRLVMGTKNAATVAQNAYTHALNTQLKRESYDHIANFADDFLGGADTYEALITHFEEFLKMCRATGITLNPKKIRIGYEQEQFYGLKVKGGRIEPADRNLDPIKRMTTPKTRSDLRSIMGIFNQFSSFIKDYGRDDSPATILNSLMSPKVPFIFTDKHQKALDALKLHILNGVHLYAPDNDHQLILETDGSADGWGAVLFQIINGEKRIIKMWSKQWKTEAWAKKPTYHREAKAWMNGLTLTVPYALQNKFPVKCWTDHTPLTWIKHTSGKGPVSQFIVDMLSIIDYEMNYIRGEDNKTADALSRFPLLGPARLHQHGTRKAVNILLAALVSSDANPHKLWFDTGKDTQHLVSDVYDWRHETTKGKPKPSGKQHCYMDTLSVSNLKRVKYTLGIWAPPSDKVTQQCREAFEKGSPFACLVPNDLVHHIPVDRTGKASPKIQDMVNKAFKITLLAPGLTWIVHGVAFDEGSTIRTVYAGEAESDVHGTDRVTEEYELQQLVKALKSSNITPPLPEFSTREKWIQEQKKHRTKLIYEGVDGVYEAPDGLLVYEDKPGAPLRTIVPDSIAIPLVQWQHKNLCHVGPQKVLHTLKARFYWKGMRRVCQYVNDMCALCNLLKARMRLAHKHFRPKLHCKPRTAYGADYYGVVQNKQGFNNILGIIDLADGYLVLQAVKRRSGANTAHVVFYEIVARKGVPQLFHSDAAKELIGKAMRALSSILGFKLSNTLAHNPKGNAKIERVWQFVGRCLQSMTPEQYKNFHLYLPMIAHVWNTTPDSDTGITPFEAEHGMKCTSVAESILEDTPKEGLPASADDLRTIATSVTAFNEVIANVKAVEKAQAAIRLNANGTSKITYEVGDSVSFYLPPDDNTVKKMGKKRKHILQYCGPAEIVEVLSPTTFKLKYKGRSYYRNVMHMNRYKAQEEVPANLQIVVDNTVSVGTYVAVLDDDEDRHYHLAQVLDVNDRETELHYLGTKSRSIRSAVWSKLYRHPGTNHVTFDQPENLVRHWTRYTGSIDTKEPGESLIVMANVGFTDTRRMNHASRRILSRKNITHHVMTHTWNP